MEFSRQEQLTVVLSSMERHARIGELLRKAAQTHSSQASHLVGLYEEVDKLTKGKTLVPTSDLLIELANSLITDAKALIYRDTYLDRLKIFVPAGDNPAYPDVLIALRVLQQSSDRFRNMLSGEGSKHSGIGNELQTILAALRAAESDEEAFESKDELDESSNDEEEESADDEEPDEDEDEDEYSENDDGDEANDGDNEDEDVYEEYVQKNDVHKWFTGGTMSEHWFVKIRGGDQLFDFDKLDNGQLPKYEPPKDGITFVQSENDY